MSPPLRAQDAQTQTALAKQYVEDGEFEKAIPVYKTLYERAPFDKSLYQQYWAALMGAKRYEDAEKLVRYMMNIRRTDASLYVDLGLIKEAEKKNKEAKQQFETALANLNADEFSIKALAEAFEDAGKIEYAAEVYERARTLLNHPYLYATQLSLLYSKLGKTKEAIRAVLDLAYTQPNILEDIQESFVKMIDQEAKNFTLIQNELTARIKAQPNHPIWQELVSWLFVQKGDYTGAYQTLLHLDQSLEEQGQRLIPFAQMVAKDKQFALAEKSYDYVLSLGASKPFYELAARGKIELDFHRFEQEWPRSKPRISQMAAAFQQFFSDFPKYRGSELVGAYAKLYARYQNRADTAIAILENVLAEARLPRNLIGTFKLDMGDYFVLEDKIWDATLIYSQVDKEFKEDYLGEEARFRNAKLAYYRGDFDWAKGQLSVLKASTTKLIANDALDLSVVLTENLPPGSDPYPLERFADADRLLFQHRTKESDRLLDSIATAFPTSPLKDDILLLRAKIALEEGRVDNAIEFLKQILAEFATDVLADDAAFRLAEIYQFQKKDMEKARTYYEKVIIDYPGSTFVQDARKRYLALKDKALP